MGRKGVSPNKTPATPWTAMFADTFQCPHDLLIATECRAFARGSFCKFGPSNAAQQEQELMSLLTQNHDSVRQVLCNLNEEPPSRETLLSLYRNVDTALGLFLSGPTLCNIAILSLRHSMLRETFSVGLALHYKAAMPPPW